MVATDFRLLHWVLAATFRFLFEVSFSINKLIIPPLPGGGGGILFYLCPSVQDIFLSNYRWQKSDISSQASYRYAILWVAFLDLSDSYFLFADLVGFYTHWTYMHIFRHIFLSNYWWHKSDIWSQASYWDPISWEALLDTSEIQIPTSCLPTLLIFYFLYTLNIYAHFSSHFSQQILMAEIWYFVTSFI
jgi:hypothetical protein